MLTSWITSQISQCFDREGCFKLNALLSSQHRTPTAIIPLLLRFWRVNSISGCSLYIIIVQLDSKGGSWSFKTIFCLFFFFFLEVHTLILESKGRSNGGFTHCTGVDCWTPSRLPPSSILISRKSCLCNNNLQNVAWSKTSVSPTVRYQSLIIFIHFIILASSYSYVCVLIRGHFKSKSTTKTGRCLQSERSTCDFMTQHGNECVAMTTLNDFCGLWCYFWRHFSSWLLWWIDFLSERLL